MSTKETTRPEAEETEATGGRKKLLVIVAVLVLALGAGGYFFLFAGSGEAKAKTPEPGAILTVDPIAVNLAGGGYLKIGIKMQLTADVGEKDKPDTAKATDLVISTFSQAKPADVVGARETLKTDLQRKIIKAYGEDVVMGIYYTDYVTQ